MSDPIESGAAGSSTSLSKRLAFVLRHDPGSIGLTPGPGGWVPVPDLLAALAAHGTPLTRAELGVLVSSSDKRRFALDPVRNAIRASSGHSVPVDLGLAPGIPPPVLFHGTVARFVPSIERDGLVPGSRQSVHLSPDVSTALQVGRRRGRPVLFEVAARTMSEDGHSIVQAENGVWLTDHVPPQYLTRRVESEPSP